MLKSANSVTGNKKKLTKLERPSLHCLVFGAKLQGVNVKLLPSEGTQTSGATVQDLWESNFKKLGEENPEQSVTGFLLFYPYHLTGYLESNEEGLRRCLQVLIALSNKDSAKVEAYKVANIQHNIQQRLFPNSIFVRSMEAPLEREIKSAGSGKNQAKKEKSSLEQRLQLTKTMFQLIGFIRKQAPLSVKKAMDLVCEKMTSLLPEPSNIAAVASDTTIPDPLPNMAKFTPTVITLGEDEVWPMPKESFQLNVIL